MKTEKLKELGLTEDQISEVMKENGKDIASEQKKLQAADWIETIIKASWRQRRLR